MPNKVAIILGNYKDYAERYLGDCLRGIERQNYQDEIKVFIFDNETSPKSFETLSRMAPQAELILNKNNDGFAKGNNDAMKLALAQSFDYIFLLNMDTIIDENCVTEMIKAIDSDKKIGAVQALLLLHPETDKINSIGNTTHFLGFGYSDGYRELLIDHKLSNREIHYPSGAAVMFQRHTLETIGLFDEELWMYNEDQDIGWSLWLAGFKCVLAKDAIVYHKYEFSRSITKHYWMDRNRLIVIFKNYHWLTLILILPALMVMEFGLILFSLKSGWFSEKKKVWQYFLRVSTWGYLWRARQKTQQLRKVGDNKIIDLIVGRIWYQEIEDWKLKIMNPVFDLYWQIIKALIKLFQV